MKQNQTAEALKALAKENLKTFINTLIKNGARCDWQTIVHGHTIERWSAAPNALILQIFPGGGFTYYFESNETAMCKCLEEVNNYFNPAPK